MDYNLSGTQDIIYFCYETHSRHSGIWHWTLMWMASFLCFIFHMLPWYYFPQRVIWRTMLFSMSLKICQRSCQKMWLEHVVAHLWYFIHRVEKSSIKILSQEFFKKPEIPVCMGESLRISSLLPCNSAWGVQFYWCYPLWWLDLHTFMPCYILC